VPLSVFPVAAEGGPHYSDDFGYVKPGAPAGSKGHQGIDIFATKGTPVLAPDAGECKLTTDPIGGQVFYVTSSSDDVVYYGAHLSAYEGSSRTVAAGEVIGYVGNTGNAASTSPHLHFEMHPGGGAAVDPFATLQTLTPPVSSSGSPASPFALADSDMTALQARLDTANAQLATDLQSSPGPGFAGQWLGDSIALFQAVGGFGVATVAPDIDSAGAASTTQRFTQQAWLVNKQLAAIPLLHAFDDSAKSDALSAQSMASTIVATYQQAIASGKAALATPKPNHPPSPGPGPSGKPDLSRFATITPGLAGKALIAAYLAKHPSSSYAPLDKIALALAWAVGPEGSFTRSFQGSNNWGSYHATSGWIEEHQTEPGYGRLAFMDHAPAAYIATMRINPSPLVGARGFLDLVEKDVGDWSSLIDEHDFATRLYVAGYFGGFHANRTPTQDRPAALAAGTLTADDQANIADGASAVARVLPAAQYALALGLNDTGDPSAPTVGPPFAPLADRLTEAHPPHTLEHARQLLAAGDESKGISLSEALAAPGGDGVWLFGPANVQPSAQPVAARTSSGGTGLAIAAAVAIIGGTVAVVMGRAA